MSGENVIKGFPIGELPNCSVAEYILPKMKSIERDRVILVDGETGESYTAWTFLTKSLQFLKGLKSLGVRSNHIVALLGRNSFEANEVMLGCWLGSIPVAPFNGFMKVQEFEHCFNLIKPRVVFCEEASLETVAAAVETLPTMPIIIVLDPSENPKYTYLKYHDLREETEDPDDFVPEPVESPKDQLLLVMPSSGTSGFPKAIGITHANLIYQDLSMTNMGFFSDLEIQFLQLSHFFWVTGILAFIKNVTVGTRRIFIKNVSPETIFKAIEDHKITSSMMAPLAFLGLSKHPEYHQRNLSSLKLMLVAGSPLTPSILKGIKEENPDVKIYQVYGLTETSGIISYNIEENFSVGKICLGVELKIADLQTGESLRENLPGEICVKCPGIMKAYVGNENLTKESIDEEGWLHTGDVGYYDENELLYVVDRIKEMIKVGGMQVAPPEIENVIARIPGVMEVGVVGIPNEINGSYLVALVVRNKSFDVTEKDVHSVVDDTLSDFKRLTGGVYFVENIPKTVTGKINRNQLRVMAAKLYSAAN